MTPTQQALQQIILILKINRVITAENLAVKNQDFATAVTLREHEVALEAQILSLEQLEELEKQLTNEQ